MFGCQLYTGTDLFIRMPVPENRAQLCDRTDAVLHCLVAAIFPVPVQTNKVRFMFFRLTSPALWDPPKTRIVDVDNGRTRLFHMPRRRVPSALRKMVRVPLVVAGEHQSSLCAVIPLRLEIDKGLFWYLYLRPAHLLEHTHAVRINMNSFSSQSAAEAYN
ncbi:uncharacterized protein ARMOST_11484 [Armillaria ostoyae]|uniref:Uncharacterized protein n=1 Tax=Armillaria ostoyae TaxID=47428 RepID=A0A284RH93_ARMOS|nr:uncharacterized protein ARMOST_11484 [Armillaria ostoyae]